MQIQHNMAALNSSRNQKINKRTLSKSLEKLSSGYRINRAGDDAAGLAISESMRQQIHGLDQAMKNVNDGIGMTNTGEGTLTEVHSMLHRMKTLAIQSANGTYSTLARANIESERLQLIQEIDRIGGATDFNGIPLFTSEIPSGLLIAPPQKDDEITLQIGHSEDETLDVTRYYMGSKALLLDQTGFMELSDANTSVDIIDNAIQAVTVIRSSFGAAQNHLDHTYNNLAVTKENMTDYESGIRDTDVSEEFVKFTATNVVSQASNSIMAQANTLPEMIMDLLRS